MICKSNKQANKLHWIAYISIGCQRPLNEENSLTLHYCDGWVQNWIDITSTVHSSPFWLTVWCLEVLTFCQCLCTLLELSGGSSHSLCTESNECSNGGGCSFSSAPMFPDLSGRVSQLNLSYHVLLLLWWVCERQTCQTSTTCPFCLVFLCLF